MVQYFFWYFSWDKMAKSNFTIQNSAQNNVTKKDYGMFLHVLLWLNFF